MEQVLYSFARLLPFAPQTLHALLIRKSGNTAAYRLFYFLIALGVQREKIAAEVVGFGGEFEYVLFFGAQRQEMRGSFFAGRHAHDGFFHCCFRFVGLLFGGERHIHKVIECRAAHQLGACSIIAHEQK